MKSQSYNPCRCCQATASQAAAMTRRSLLGGAAGAGLFPQLALSANATAGRYTPAGKALKVQPVLVYTVPKRVEARSWREWGGIQTEQDAEAERARIGREIAGLASPKVEFLPLASARTLEQAAAIGKGPQDLTLIYAAGGRVGTIEALAPAEKWAIMFVRHRSGPVYLWYEIAHPRFLRKTVDEYGQPGMDVQDVVVDNADELRLALARALAA